jgi:hypothetical protein
MADDDGVRDLPDPGFAGDDGRAAPELVAALAANDADPDRLQAATLLVLQRSRLLVPVVAVLGEVDTVEAGPAAGLTRDKTSDMATVMVQGPDGRTALLAFSGSESLRRWRADARPVPVTAARAAEAALQDGAVAVVVDIAGPVVFVVPEPDLRALADGLQLVPLDGGHAWVRHQDLDADFHPGGTAR